MRCRALLLGAGWAIACGLMYPVHGVADEFRSAENARLLIVAPALAVPTDLFASHGDAPGTPVATDDELSVITWQVVPRIVALARAPKQLRVVLGTREALVVNQLRFEPREGFYLAEEPDDYIVDDDPTRVSYYWYGSSGTTLVFLTVHRGIVNGTVYARDHRYTLTSSSDGHLFRDVDMSVLNAGVCRNAEIARITPNPGALGRFGDYAAPLSGSLPPARIARAAAAMATEKAPTPRSPAAGTEYGPKYRLPLSIKFYFTVEAAQFFDGAYNPVTNPGAGQAQLAGRALHYIDEINQVMNNSGGLSHYAVASVGPPTLLTYTDGTPFEEAFFSQLPPLSRFANYLYLAALNDYGLDTTVTPPRRRRSVDADIAVLMVGDDGDPSPNVVYGAAYTQRPNCYGNGSSIPPWPTCGVGTGAYRGYAFAAVSLPAGTANFTFSHEVGHVHGNDHDYPNRNSDIDIYGHSFAHSFGYRASTTRDVMADPPCGFPGPVDSCPRSMQYSNPETTFLNAPTVVAGTPGGRACPQWSPNFGVCAATAHAALTVSKLAFGTADIYPEPSTMEAPTFHDGFEF